MKMKIVALCVSVGLVLALAGCAEEEQPLTWEEFQDQAYQDPDGVYVVNGDEPAEDLAALHDYYLDYLASISPDGIGRTQQGLAVNRVGGQDDKWSSSAAQNISYCVSRSSFSTSEYNAVVSALNSATSTWESAANVNFTHNSGQDNNCTRNNNSVVFDVNRQCNGSFLARAFFPSSSRRNRNIIIDCTSFGNISPVDARRRAAPRAGTHARLPPRAHPPRVGDVLRGQQLARADHVRLRLGHALPAVQRQPGRRPRAHDARSPGRRGALRSVIIA